MRVAVAMLLLAGVLAAWLAALGLLRRRDPLDRLHLVSFVNVATGLPVAVAALLQGGASSRSVKVVLLLGITWIAGAVLAHASGRALVVRKAAGEQG